MMRALVLFMLFVLFVLELGCGHGESIGPNACDHVEGDSKCCTTQEDCIGFAATCAPPGAFLGCGACDAEPETCTTDTDCKPMGATMICEVRTCACDGQRDCVPGCTADNGCGEGAACDLSTNRCIPKPCTTDPECPADFACTSGACARRTCSDSSQCDAFCVDGQCYQAAGECRSPPP